jgi:hypothetical protein
MQKELGIKNSVNPAENRGITSIQENGRGINHHDQQDMKRPISSH